VDQLGEDEGSVRAGGEREQEDHGERSSPSGPALHPGVDMPAAPFDSLIIAPVPDAPSTLSPDFSLVVTRRSPLAAAVDRYDILPAVSRLGRALPGEERRTAPRSSGPRRYGGADIALCNRTLQFHQ